MDVGIGLPTTIPGVTGDQVLEWVRRGEARQFSCLGTIDRTLLAKQAATLDHLSGGRLVLGVAVGGREDDYEVSGVDFHTRGKRFDAMLAEMEHLWDGGSVGPTPPRGRPTLIVGGSADVAFERAARYGDGWIMGGGTPDAFKEGAEKLRAAWQDAGRDGEPRTMALAYSSPATRRKMRPRAPWATTTRSSASTPT